ncbi:fused (3R)-hydroxyacyl-ACP dehydratase subunits HadA/HadB [Nocardia cyriacigeorgica]|uniref:fused (3R)-hydroxyacyl-ACP dehydratase subunits HadA/HadB n=1 Tax=Nocardia cyriacigeorgica TaxID=135487 RepID=UPI002456DF92|nr:fused (3R)-hydroxyacyl-ACP dehydratase subunits HadA/HadB [Nocardia cyriacigeorgica]
MGREQSMARPDDEVVRTATLAGRRFRIRDHYVVGREKIREFARAVQNDHGAHQHEVDARKLGYDGVVAPPTFASVIGMSATNVLLDSVLTDYDLSQILQTDQVFQVYRPMVAGDRITTEVEVESIRQFNDNDFIHVKFLLTNQDGEVSQVGTTTIVARRGVEVAPDIAEAVENIMMQGRADAEHAALGELDALIELDADAVDTASMPSPAPVHTDPEFDRLSVGDEIDLGTATLTRGDLANYAGVSGDSNPIHFSEHAAKLAGLPTTVAHGLLTMGLAGGKLTSWLGDPTAVESLSVRFAGFVPVAADARSVVEFSGKIKKLDPERRTATIMLSGKSQGRKLFGRAIAEVRLG